MTYHNKEKQEVLQELNVQEATGLSSSEVKKRREQYGENRLRAKKSKSNWERFAEQFKDVMILILLAAAAISFVVGLVPFSAGRAERWRMRSTTPCSTVWAV